MRCDSLIKLQTECCAMSSVMLLIYVNLAGDCGPFVFSLMEIQRLQDGRI